jgi:hypothetical protein
VVYLNNYIKKLIFLLLDRFINFHDIYTTTPTPYTTTPYTLHSTLLPPTPLPPTHYTLHTTPYTMAYTMAYSFGTVTNVMTDAFCSVDTRFGRRNIRLGQRLKAVYPQCQADKHDGSQCSKTATKWPNIFCCHHRPSHAADIAEAIAAHDREVEELAARERRQTERRAAARVAREAQRVADHEAYLARVERRRLKAQRREAAQRRAVERAERRGVDHRRVRFRARRRWTPTAAPRIATAAPRIATAAALLTPLEQWAQHVAALQRQAETRVRSMH